MGVSHHAAVQVLVHLAEGVWGRLPFAGDDDAEVGDSEGGVGLALGRPAVRDVDALRGVAADVGWTAGGRGLDEVAALLQTFLPLVQHPGGPGGETSVSSGRLQHRFHLSRWVCC